LLRETVTLTEILTQVAEGKLSVAEAEKLIRQGPSRPPLRQNKPYLVGLIFLVIGSSFALIGFVFGYFSWSSANGASEVEGTVIQLVASGTRGGKTPIVRYQLGEQTFDVQGGVSTSPPAYSVNENVKVFYHADRPEQGRIYSFTEFWLFPVIFGGIGILFASIGSFVILTRGRFQYQTRFRA
jgi:hypothetical protein